MHQKTFESKKRKKEEATGIEDIYTRMLVTARD
jgi:hypothetical protein